MTNWLFQLELWANVSRFAIWATSDKQVLGLFCGIMFINQISFIPSLLTDINWNVKWLQSLWAEIRKEKKVLFVFVLSLSEISPVTFRYIKAFIRQWTLLWVTKITVLALQASQCTSFTVYQHCSSRLQATSRTLAWHKTFECSLTCSQSQWQRMTY